MPRQTQLATVPITALVEELNRRFAEFEKAKKQLLADGLQRVVVGNTSGRGRVLFDRKKRGGTSPYSQDVSRIVQKVRHAKNRIKRGTARPGDEKLIQRLEKRLKTLRSQHKRP